MRRKIFRIGAVLVLLLLFPSYLSAGLGTFEFKIIKIAFMNGYVRAIHSEDRTIQMLRANRQYMEAFVIREAENYMIQVKDLNKKIPDQEVVEASSEIIRKNNNW